LKNNYFPILFLKLNKYSLYKSLIYNSFLEKYRQFFS